MAVKSRIISKLFLLCFFFNSFAVVKSWDQIDLELFDLVEELKENFYKILSVEQTASSAEIRRAYRKLSLQLHPDRNKEPDAEIKFRQLVAAAEVLRDEEKRKRYDGILRDGLPDWRQPVFYYRRARKMGIIEFFLLLFVILTIGHFIVIWSVFLEKKFEMEELLSSKMKREEKKRRKAKEEFIEENITEIADALVHETGYTRPTFFDLLPFKICKSTIAFWVSLPAWYRAYQEHKEEIARQKLEEEQQQLEEENEPVEQPRPRRRQRVTIPEELPDDDDSAWAAAPVINMIEPEENDDEDHDEKFKSEEWTDEDFSRLSRAMVKFPGGTSKRWVKIAQEMGKSVEMVTKQMKKIRQTQGVATNPVGPGAPGKLVTGRKVATINEDILTKADPGTSAIHDDTDETKTKVTTNETDPVTWTQNQQKLLEMALQQYPKTTPDRWTCIARSVPGMAKEDCIARYKTLVELMRQKKAQESK